MALLSVQVFEHQMCSEEAVDAHRFKDIIDSAVADGKARASKPYQAWAARVAKRAPPKDPLAWPPKKSLPAGRSSIADLALAMRCVHCRSFLPFTHSRCPPFAARSQKNMTSSTQLSDTVHSKSIAVLLCD